MQLHMASLHDRVLQWRRIQRAHSKLSMMMGEYSLIVELSTV